MRLSISVFCLAATVVCRTLAAEDRVWTVGDVRQLLQPMSQHKLTRSLSDSAIHFVKKHDRSGNFRGIDLIPADGSGCQDCELPGLLACYWTEVLTTVQAKKYELLVKMLGAKVVADYAVQQQKPSVQPCLERVPWAQDTAVTGDSYVFGALRILAGDPEFLQPIEREAREQLAKWQPLVGPAPQKQTGNQRMQQVRSSAW